MEVSTLLMADDWGAATPAGSPLDALGLAWAKLASSPPGTVVVITTAGDTWAMKTTDQLEVIFIPF